MPADSGSSRPPACPSAASAPPVELLAYEHPRTFAEVQLRPRQPDRLGDPEAGLGQELEEPPPVGGQGSQKDLELDGLGGGDYPAALMPASTARAIASRWSWPRFGALSPCAHRPAMCGRRAPGLSPSSDSHEFLTGPPTYSYISPGRSRSKRTPP
jgi:hypothetical protein